MKWVRDAAGDYEARSGEYTARLLLCEDRGPNKWKWALDRLNDHNRKSAWCPTLRQGKQEVADAMALWEAGGKPRK